MSGWVWKIGKCGGWDMEEKIRKRHRKMEGILMGVGNRLNTYSPDTPPYVVLCSFPTRGQAVPSEFNFISPLTVLVAVTPSALPINQISHASIKSVMRQSNQSCVNQISHASIKSVMRQSNQSCVNQISHASIKSVMRQSNQSCVNEISHASMKSVMRQSNQSCVNQISHASIKSVMRQ